MEQNQYPVFKYKKRLNYILPATANYTIVCCAAFGGYKIIDFSGHYEGWLCGAAAPMGIAKC